MDWFLLATDRDWDWLSVSSMYVCVDRSSDHTIKLTFRVPLDAALCFEALLAWGIWRWLIYAQSIQLLGILENHREVVCHMKVLSATGPKHGLISANLCWWSWQFENTSIYIHMHPKRFRRCFVLKANHHVSCPFWELHTCLWFSSCRVCVRKMPTCAAREGRVRCLGGSESPTQGSGVRTWTLS